MNKNVREVLYETLQNKLMNIPKGENESFLESYIQNLFNEALQRPNSKSGVLVSQMFINGDTINLLSESTQKEMENNREFACYKLSKSLTPKQNELMNVVEHNTKTIGITSRRLGKSFTGANAVIQFCVKYPGCFNLIIGLTAESTKKQYWQNILDNAERAGLVIAQQNKADGTLEFSNGSSIKLGGNSNKEEADKYRGNALTGICIIDEVGHQKYGLKYLVEDVVTPMLQSKESRLLMIGTPPRIPHHYSERCWNNDTFGHFHGTAVDNPHLGKPFKEMIADVCREKGVDETDSLIRREYFGEFAYDTEAQCYKGYQTYGKLPKDFKTTNIYIGVDFGFEDFNGIARIDANLKEKRAFVTEERKFNHADIMEIMLQINDVYKKAKKEHPFARIKIITDTNEPALAQTLYQEGLPVEKAYKANKIDMMQYLATMLRRGVIKIKKGGYLEDEFQQIVYKRDEETDAVLPEIDEDVFHPDIADALKYASRTMFEEMGYSCPTGKFGLVEEKEETVEEVKEYKPENPFKGEDKKDDNGLQWDEVQWD